MHVYLVVSVLVFPVLSQETGWEERLQNDRQTATQRDRH